MCDLYKRVLEMLPTVETRRYYRTNGTTNDYKKECTIVDADIHETLFVVCSARYFKTTANKQIVDISIEVFVGNEHRRIHKTMLYRTNNESDAEDRAFINEMFKFAKKVRGNKNARK